MKNEANVHIDHSTRIRYTHLISKSIIENKTIQYDIKYLYVDKHLTFHHYVIYLTYQNITYNCSTTSNIY